MSTNTPQSNKPTETPLPSPSKVHLGRFKTMTPQGNVTMYSRRDKLDRNAIRDAQVALEAKPEFKAADDASKQKMKDDVEKGVVDKRKKKGLHVSCMFLENRRAIRPLDGGGKVDEEDKEVITDDGNEDDDEEEEEEDEEEEEEEEEEEKEDGKEGEKEN